MGTGHIDRELAKIDNVEAQQLLTKEYIGTAPKKKTSRVGSNKLCLALHPGSYFNGIVLENYLK